MYCGHACAFFVVSIIQRHWHFFPNSSPFLLSPYVGASWLHSASRPYGKSQSFARFPSSGSLAQLLLPVVIIVELLFLPVFPVTGLAPLWGTGNGTALLMALTGLVLPVQSFISEKRQTARIIRMHVLITIGVIVLPILCH